MGGPNNKTPTEQTDLTTSQERFSLNGLSDMKKITLPQDDKINSDHGFTAKKMLDSEGKAISHIEPVKDANGKVIERLAVYADGSKKECTEINSYKLVAGETQTYEDKNGKTKESKNNIIGVHPFKLPTDPVTYNGKKEFNFDLDSDKLQTDQATEAEINRLADYIKNNPSAQITISGHTDTSGNKDYNQDLSERRTKAFSNRLIQELSERGIEYPDQRVIFSESSRGEQDNKVKTNDGVQNAENRRVEVKIDHHFVPHKIDAVTTYYFDNNSKKEFHLQVGPTKDDISGWNKKYGTELKIEEVDYTKTNVVFDSNIKNPVEFKISELNKENVDLNSVMIKPINDGKPHSYEFVEKEGKLHAQVDGRTIAIVTVTSPDGTTLKDLHVGVAKPEGVEVAQIKIQEPEKNLAKEALKESDKDTASIDPEIFNRVIDKMLKDKNFEYKPTANNATYSSEKVKSLTQEESLSLA